MIYTTFFENLQDLPSDIIPVSICLKPPDSFTGLEYKKLAPKRSFFDVWQRTRDNTFYTDCFNKQVLEQLNINKVLNDLKELICINGLNEDMNIALVCYEPPQDFCHRHLVAQWLNQNGIPCTEWKKIIK